jgi:DNA-binding transcriptional LysR family regulator
VHPRFLPDLLVFLEVARSGSISKAARRLHTVQTNVSARMQKLEATLGSKLLTRTARGIDLTMAGEKLLPVARRLDSLLGDLGQVFPKSCSRSPALIRIGSLETFAATHLAGLMPVTIRSIRNRNSRLRTEARVHSCKCCRGTN